MRAVLFVLLGFPLLAAAQAPALAPGEYISDRGWGTLVVKPGKLGALKFKIDSMGANGHSCGLDGEIRNNTAILEALDKDKPCRVAFTPTADGVKVEDKGEDRVCQYFCGMRASFADTYLKVSPACTSAAQLRDWRAFDQLYKQKKYAAARDKLTPLLANCNKSIYLWNEYRMRNDLAITLHHLGDDAACREILLPLRQYAAMTNAQLNEEFPPTDAENMMITAKAARTNLRLCGEVVTEAGQKK